MSLERSNIGFRTENERPLVKIAPSTRISYPNFGKAKVAFGRAAYHPDRCRFIRAIIRLLSRAQGVLNNPHANTQLVKSLSHGLTNDGGGVKMPVCLP